MCNPAPRSSSLFQQPMQLLFPADVNRPFLGWKKKKIRYIYIYILFAGTAKRLTGLCFS